MTPQGDRTRQAVIAEARQWIGTPYRHQGRARGVGCDCLGLVLGVWKALYGDTPDAPADYAMQGDWADDNTLVDGAARLMRPVAVQEAAAGDLIILRWRREMPPRHFGILSAETRFIHAYHGTAVTESSLAPPWRRRIAAAFAFPDISSI